jgi:farnesyl-diphosphate farnesyltransferase
MLSPSSPLLLRLTCYQLFIAWLAGARFDIAYAEFKEQMGQLLGFFDEPEYEPVSTIVETVVKDASGHSEL